MIRLGPAALLRRPAAEGGSCWQFRRASAAAAGILSDGRAYGTLAQDEMVGLAGVGNPLCVVSTAVRFDMRPASGRPIV